MSENTGNTTEKSASPISWDDLQNTATDEPEFLSSKGAEVPSACSIDNPSCESCQ